MNLIAFPFRLAPNGSVITQEDGTEAYFAGELAVLTSTVPGERLLVPGYGMEDLTFNIAPLANLQTLVEEFGPPVAITEVDISQTGEQTVSVIVGFDLIDADDIESDYSVGA